VRALVLWCPDWPVVAAVAAESTAGGPTGIEDADHIPVAVLSANRVVACSAAARAEGVRRGQRKREAQGRCPDLVTLPHDPAVAARGPSNRWSLRSRR
jgi:protein ImuB